MGTYKMKVKGVKKARYVEAESAESLRRIFASLKIAWIRKVTDGRNLLLHR